MADSGGSVARRTLAGAGWLIAWRMVTRALGFISTLVLARLLVPADFGLVAMATAFAGSIDALSQFSVQDMLVRRPEEDTRLHDAAFTLQAGRALLTGGIIALGAPAAAAWFADPRLLPMLLVLALLSAVSGLENIGTVAFRREMRFDVQFQISLIPRLMQVAVTIAVAWSIHSYWALLAGMATMRLARLAMTYVVHPYRPRFALAGWGELAGFSSWLWAASLARLVWDRYEAFAIGPKFGSASLGLYQTALLVALLPVSELVAPAADVLLAGFSLAERSGGKAVRETLALALALLLLLAPMGLAMSAGAGDVVNLLLGPQWVAAQPLVAIFAWVCLLSPVSYVCSAAMVAKGAVWRDFVAMGVAALTKVVLVSAAVRVGGLALVAGASVLSTIVEALLFALLAGGISSLRTWSVLGGFVRVAVGGLVAGVVLKQTGLGWLPLDTLTRGGGPSGIGVAMAHLMLTGIVTVAVCWGSVGALWLAVGRPEGPEAILARVAGQFFRPWLLRLRISRIDRS